MAAVNDIYQVRVLTELPPVAPAGRQIGLIIRHYQAFNITGTGSLDSFFAQGIDGAIAAPLKALMSAGATYRGVGVKRIWPLPEAVETSAIGNLGPGTVAGDLLPSQVSGLVSLRTAFAGRKFRGRMFIPFPGETDNAVQGVPSAGYLTRMNTFHTALIATFVTGVGGNTNSWAPVLYHRTTHTTDLLLPALSVLNNVWATQRRRGGLGRQNTPPF